MLFPFRLDNRERETISESKYEDRFFFYSIWFQNSLRVENIFRTMTIISVHFPEPLVSSPPSPSQSQASNGARIYVRVKRSKKHRAGPKSFIILLSAI